MRKLMVNLVLLWYTWGYIRNGKLKEGSEHIDMIQWSFECPDCGNDHTCENCRFTLEKTPDVFIFANVAYLEECSMYIINDSCRVKLVDAQWTELAKIKNRGFVVWEGDKTTIDGIEIKRHRKVSRMSGRQYIFAYSVTVNETFILKFSRLYALLDFLESSYEYTRGQWSIGKVRL